jgi:hypothetical protein
VRTERELMRWNRTRTAHVLHLPRHLRGQIVPGNQQSNRCFGSLRRPVRILQVLATTLETEAGPHRNPLPPFSKSEHNSTLILPPYRQKLKQEVPVIRTIQCWSDQSESTLQDCSDHADWDMFRVASENNIEEFTQTVN